MLLGVFDCKQRFVTWLLGESHMHYSSALDALVDVHNFAQFDARTHFYASSYAATLAYPLLIDECFHLRAFLHFASFIPPFALRT